MAKKKAILKKKAKKISKTKIAKPKKAHANTNQTSHDNKIVQTYYKEYKKLLIIPAILLILSLLNLGMLNAQTGDYFIKGITLSGGVTVTALQENLDETQIREFLRSEFPEYQINTRNIQSGGTSAGLIIESNIVPEDQNISDAFIESISQQTAVPKNDLSVESIGASLGDAFFRQASLAVLVAFIFMAVVVYAYFSSIVPSVAVVLAAFSNIITTIAILNLMQISIGTAGIAALLMLIGYSVDTDILLTTRMLKEREGTSFERLIGAFKTGMTMSVTTFLAISVTYLLAQSEVLREILLIVMIGLAVDQINTWLQNAGIIRYYLEKKGVDHE